MRGLLTILLTAAAVAAPLSAAQAQVRIGGSLGGLADDGGLGLGQPVTISARFSPPEGDRPALLAITADIAPGWHVYSLTQPAGGPTPTRIELAPDGPARLLGPFRAEPPPTSRIDQEAWVGLTIEEHAGRVVWYAPIEFTPGVDPAQAQVRGTVRMLACKESCIPVNLDFTARRGQIVGLRAGSSSTPATGAEDRPARFNSPVTVGSFQPEGSEVKISGELAPAVVAPGGTATLSLTLTPPAKMHVYAYAPRDDRVGSKPTLIALEQLSGLTAGSPQTDSTVQTDNSVPEFGPMHYHDGPVTWTVQLQVPADARPGDYPIAGLIGYQACETRDDGLGSCELQQAARFETNLRVGEAAGATATSLTFAPATYKDAATAAEGQGAAPGAGTSRLTSISAASLVLILGGALLGGLILNVMPCVLPVIGLKILAFAEQGGESRGRIFRLNLAYAAGLISVFLLLATLASLVQLGLGSENYEWGELYTLTWFKLAMIALVFAMALSFLGVWEIPIPGFAGTGTAARLATREGYAGAIFKGIFTTILATPCSGPFLGPVFGFTIGQPAWLTYLIFLFVGLGMAAPYLVIGAFPSLIHRLPRPGAWMQVFKELMGFLLLGTVVYLISTIDQQYVIATLTMLVGIWFACWWIGRTPLTASEGKRRMAWVGAIGSAAVVTWLAFRLLTPGQFELPWKPYSQAALTAARADGKTVLVDFTADWCLTCKTNLKFSLNRPAVRKLVEQNGVVTLVADWTDGDPAIKQALEALGSRSIPLLAIYPADPSREVIVLPDVVTQSEVLEALERAGPSRPGGNVAEVAPASAPLN